MTTQPEGQSEFAFKTSISEISARELVDKFEEVIRQGMGPSHWKLWALKTEILRRMCEVQVIIRDPSPIECVAQALRDIIADREEAGDG
jgi:hypothetical protein